MDKMLSREKTEEGTIEEQHPMALMIKVNADDNSTFQQAMRSPEADAWYNAVEKEFNSLVNLDAWEEVRRDRGKTNVFYST